MKTKFYCVLAELYEGRYNGTKQGVQERICKEKPENQYRQQEGMAAFKIWYTSETDANELCEEVRTGDVGIDTLIGLCGSAA